MAQNLKLEQGIKTEILSIDDDFAMIEKTYDLTHPKCPAIVGRWIGGKFVKNADATFAVERLRVPVRMFEDLKHGGGG